MPLRLSFRMIFSAQGFAESCVSITAALRTLYVRTPDVTVSEPFGAPALAIALRRAAPSESSTWITRVSAAAPVFATGRFATLGRSPASIGSARGVAAFFDGVIGAPIG